MSEPSSETGPKPTGPSNLAVRLLTAAVVVPLLLWLLYWGPWQGFFGVVALASAIAALELGSMVLPGRPGLQAYVVAASLAVLAAFFFAEAVVGPLVMALVALGFLFSLGVPDPIESAAGRTAWLVTIPLYAGGLLSATALLHARPNGAGWVVLSMMLAWFADTGGYFAGRAFGKHKLYPKLSPKKTVEGAFGGLAGSLVGVLAAHFWYLPELPLPHAVGLAIVASAAGQAGDLTISLVKRSTGVKDSGFIVPGHGGLLDRIDGLVMTSAVTWAFARYVLDAAHR